MGAVVYNTLLVCICGVATVNECLCWYNAHGLQLRGSQYDTMRALLRGASPAFNVRINSCIADWKRDLWRHIVNLPLCVHACVAVNQCLCFISLAGKSDFLRERF